MDETHKLAAGSGRKLRREPLAVFLLFSGLLGICLLCGALAGCGLVGGSAPSSTTTAATPAPLDLSSNDLSVVTQAVADAVKAAPGIAPYVQSVANFFHAHANLTAPSPAEVSLGLGLLTSAVPALTSITTPVNAWYAAHYGIVAAAQSAEPLIEQLAAAIEAGATPAS